MLRCLSVCVHCCLKWALVLLTGTVMMLMWLVSVTGDENVQPWWYICLTYDPRADGTGPDDREQAEQPSVPQHALPEVYSKVCACAHVCASVHACVCVQQKQGAAS